MLPEVIQTWQSVDVGFRIAALSGVVAAYGLFELVITTASLRRSRAR